jgi:transcription initiation factor IIE alpha subunit
MDAKTYELDRYVLDTLMADLVGHDHRPSSFLVYLAIVAASRHGRVTLSYAELAERTGLSKRSTQMAVAALQNRRLLDIHKRQATDPPEYVPLSPWRRHRE